jgi:cytochrome c oxidase subunit 2
MNRRPRWSNDIKRVIWIWAGVSLILVVAAVTVPRGLNALSRIAAPRASDYAVTMVLFTVLSMPVLALVMVFALYSLFKGRTAGRPTRDGPAIRAGRGVQIAWVGISAVLVTSLYAWGLIFLNRADAAPAPGSNVLDVYVTGEQWNWNFTYPQYGNAQSDVLEVPVNRPILFKITSIDVDHSFSVPAWGLKEDAVPGDWTYIRVTPDTMGNYSVRCFELCGLFHAYMEAPVRVVSPADFSAWVAKQPTGYPWGIGGAAVPNQYSSPSSAPK